MSRFFRPNLTLVIAGGLALLQEKSFFRKTRQQEKSLSAISFEERLDEALALLPATPARLQIFLPSRQFLFWQVPWISTRLSEAECFELAANLLRQDFEVSAQDWAVTLSPARFGHARLACGMARSSLDRLRQLLPAGITLAGVHPLLSLSWSTLCAQREPRLYTEPGLAALLIPAADGPRLHCRRLAPDQLADNTAAQSLAALFGIEVPRPFPLQLDAGARTARQGDALDLALLMRAA